eukprot:6868507-Prorocentrum_lima.AAC.1
MLHWAHLPNVVALLERADLVDMELLDEDQRKELCWLACIHMPFPVFALTPVVIRGGICPRETLL